MKKFKIGGMLLAAAFFINSFGIGTQNVKTAAAEQTSYQPVIINLPQPSEQDAKNGYIPSPFTVSKSTGLYKSTVLPAKYDLRDYGYVTPVRNQGYIGDCWTFSTYGSLESVEKKRTGRTFDFSEINMAANNGDVSVDSGGNNYISSAYLVSWKGPILETDDPYPNPPYASNVVVKSGLTPQYHVQDIIYLPKRTSASDNADLKSAILSYGAVSSSYYHGSQYYVDNGQASYYNPTVTTGNHAITIIGWDDNYSAANFSSAPPGNGAFLCKNSWGDYWGDSGYFYISYYDVCLGYDLNAVFNGVESANNYKHMYSYYDKAMYSGIGGPQYAGNKYTAASDDVISAVGFYTHAQNVSYEIYVDKLTGSSVGAPVNLAASGTMSQAGYHTIKLGSKLNVLQGQQFMVWVKLTGDYYYGYSNSTMASGKSYVSYYGSVNNSSLVLGINAYSESYDPNMYISIASEDPQSGELTPSKPVTITYSEDISAGTGYNNISLKDENDSEVDKSVAISGKSLIIKELPENHLNGKLKLFIPKDAVKGTSGKYAYFDYNNTFNVYADGSTIVNFKDSALEGAVRSKLNKLSGDITALDMRNIQSLDVSNSGLRSLSGLEYAANLTQLSAQGNKIISLEPLKLVKNLSSLDISNNSVKDISALSRLTNLTTLNLSDNLIRDISPLGNMTKLGSLDLYSNLITDIGILERLSKLTSLDIGHNLIKDISTLSNLAANKTSSSLDIQMGYNFIDFSAGSAGSTVLAALDTHSVTYGGNNYQLSGLQPVAVNGDSDTYNLNISNGQKIVYEFNEPIVLSSDANNLISLYDYSLDRELKISIKAAGRTLIITPQEAIPSKDSVSLFLYAGAVLNADNNSESNAWEYTDIYGSDKQYGDFSSDNILDLRDLAELSSQYNSSVDNSAQWDAAKDINSDGIIDLYDLTIFSSYLN